MDDSEPSRSGWSRGKTLGVVLAVAAVVAVFVVLALSAGGSGGGLY